MSRVFVAEELALGRKVVVKVLPPEMSAGVNAERFRREIQLAASLQHPHIVPLLNAGQHGDLVWYTMPLIEGESLRTRLAREGELPVQDVVRLLRDVADALAYAHRHGVVHRDIKPDNVLLSGQHAVVTDFGVSKAIAAATGEASLTSIGVALGTPAYMAPEQAAAEAKIDHRADVYALGAMAYEMLTGAPPFGGDAQAVLVAHVTRAPEAVTARRAAVPAALGALVMRCLEKKPADRWQSAAELHQQLEVLATPSGGTTPAQTAPVAAFRPRRRAALAVGGVVILTAAGALSARFLRPKPLSLSIADLTQVTNAPGIEFEPALSPDGSEVAYAAGPIWAPQLMVRSTADAAGAGEVRLSDTSSQGAYVATWSPDGHFVRFAGCRASGCTWREVGKLGGVVRSPRLPPRAAGTFAAWSPDGARVAYFVAETLFVAAVADTGAPRAIAVHAARAWSPHSPAWSPDGRWIAYVNGNPQWLFSGNVSPSSIWLVSASGGAPQRVTGEDFLNVSPAWLDERHLLFVSNRDGARGVYVVEVGPHGARGAARIVPGVADPHSISYSIAGHLLAWSKFTLRQNVWSYPLRGPAPISIRSGTRVTSANEVTESVDLSPDGKWLVFESNRRGNMDLYKMPVAGGEALPLTETPEDEFFPRWSPDGTEIAYYADVAHAGGQSNSVVVMPAAGGRPVAITAGLGFNDHESWSPDGLHIAFLSTRTRRAQVWLISRDSVGGPWHDQVQLTDSGGVPWDWAPDGRGVLYLQGRSFVLVSTDKRVLWRRDLAASGLTEVGAPRFSRDGRALYFRATHEDGRRGLWSAPAAGGPPRLMVVTDDPALDFYREANPSAGRDRLYITVSEYESDIWVAKLNR